VVGESVEEHDVVADLGRLFRAAKAADMPVVISPHYSYPHDHRWQFEGALETVMHSIGMFDRPGPLDLTGLEGSGADCTLAQAEANWPAMRSRAVAEVDDL
jgi:hypothetical protein